MAQIHSAGPIRSSFFIAKLYRAIFGWISANRIRYHFASTVGINEVADEKERLSILFNYRDANGCRFQCVAECWRQSVYPCVTAVCDCASVFNRKKVENNFHAYIVVECQQRASANKGCALHLNGEETDSLSASENFNLLRVSLWFQSLLLMTSDITRVQWPSRRFPVRVATMKLKVISIHTSVANEK